MRVLTECVNGREVRLSCGETFELRLVERPTTGFRWQLVSDGAPTCLLVRQSFHASQPAVPGRAGHRSWIFRIDRPGRATIELVHCRTWEGGTPPADAFRLTVRATNGADP